MQKRDPMKTKASNMGKSVKASTRRGKKAKGTPAPHFLNHIQSAIGELDDAIKACRMASDCTFCQSRFLCQDMTLRAREFLEALPGLVAKH